MSNINYLVPAKIDLSWLQAELNLYSGLLNVVHDENTKVKREVNGYVALIAKYEREVKELKSAISNKNAALEASEAKLVSTESQNDLILLQLHQVQEAFESHLIKTDGLLKVELSNLKQELSAAKVSIEQFNQYYKMVASNKAVHAQNYFAWFKKIFAKKTQVPNLKANVVNKADNLSAHNQVLLANTPAWVEISVKSGDKLDIYANVLYRNIPLCIRKKALICFQYLDGNGNHIKNIYGKSPYSDKFNSNFGYLEPSSSGYQRVYSFVVPNSITELRIGLVSFGLYPEEGILVNDTIYVLKNDKV